MASRCLAHSFADGPCSVRDFPSGPMLVLAALAALGLLLSGMAKALCVRVGAGVGLGGIGGCGCSIEGIEGTTVLAGPDQTGATARFSGADAMAWETAGFCLQCLMLVPGDPRATKQSDLREESGGVSRRVCASVLHVKEANS